MSMTMEIVNPRNPAGFVPFFGQGLRAKETQLGAIGTKEWLKTIKLHKYWPLVSHWSYWQMMSLTVDNIAYQTDLVRGTGLTKGATGKLLRSIEELRNRRTKLRTTLEGLLNKNISLNQALSYISRVVMTPMPTSEEDPLPTIIVHTFLEVREYAWVTGITQSDQKKVHKIISEIKKNPVLKKAELCLRSSLTTMGIKSSEVKSSSILSKLLQERTRNASEDSGFQECSHEDRNPSIDLGGVWPIGENTVMFPLPDQSGLRALLRYSPFYSSLQNMES